MLAYADLEPSAKRHPLTDTIAYADLCIEEHPRFTSDSSPSHPT
jgi:hypothetical protein